MQGQNLLLRYQVKKGDSQIGSMVVSCSDSAGSKLYAQQLDAKLCLLLFTIQVKDTRNVRFTGKQLHYARAERRVFGRPAVIHETCKNGKLYTDGRHALKHLHQDPTYTTVQLLFQEPVNQQYVYSEYYQQDYLIETVEPHHYRVCMADGNTGDYFYKSGICYKVVTETRWATVISLLQSDNIASQ
jgi:hypothetical protein